VRDAITIKLGDNGRFIIPSKIRKQLNLKEGDQLRVSTEAGKIIIFTPEALLGEFYDLTQNIRSSHADVVQELLDERRQEADPTTWCGGLYGG